MQQLLEGKTGLITGASRGIGYTIAETLAEQGMRLMLTARNAERLEKAASGLKKAGARQVEIVAADLADPQTPEKIIREIEDRYGSLDVLINNAGLPVVKSFEDTSFEDWEQSMAVNARAPYFLCRNALPLLRNSQMPTIVQIASVVAHKGYTDQSVYSASKHALLGFSKSLAREVQDEDIRVHVLQPGAVATEMVAKMRPDIDPKELIQPKDLADMILFLLTHRGSGVFEDVKVRRITSTAWA
ncbi:MAG: SDR family oxidoreductase [Spirochaetales bacterium]|nr:SDR family oxidoreductase [Spirochaetales bacterium]MCF7939943.1 SDR family oxidoreductase [Spirochaetales bacterium]